MHPLESRVRRLLWHIDVDQWERQAALITLIAREAGPWPIELSTTILVELGDRTPRQARYDHDILVQLAEADRVLLRWRGGGRKADVWRLVLDVRRWRHVPWLTRRSEFLRDSPMALLPVSVALMTKTPGQALSLLPVEGQPDPLPKKLTRSFTPFEPATKVIHKATTPQSERGSGAPTGNNATDPAPPTPLTDLSENPSLPDPPNAGAEGAREGISTQAERTLAWRLKERLEDVLSEKSIAIGRGPVRIVGDLWTRVGRIAGRYDGDPDSLLARCDRFENQIFSVRRALDELEEWIAAGSPNADERRFFDPAQLEDRARKTRRLLATYRESLPADDPHVKELEDDLAAIQEQLSVTADG